LFNDRVDTLNTFLRNYFKEDRVEGVQFWRHSGFWSPENQELVDTYDKVHLNEVYGSSVLDVIYLGPWIAFQENLLTVWA
jgi:hypothetical protein